METKTGLAVRVGIFIVVGILFLLGLSLRVEKHLFKPPQGNYIQANFKDVKSLEDGAPVMLAGLNVGYVKSLSFDAEKGEVEVNLFIYSPYRLKKDSTASIRLQSLLGRYYVGVDFGDPASPDLPYGGLLKTKETIDVDTALQIVSEAGEQVKDLAKRFNENQDKLTSELSSLIEENREDIKSAVHSFAELGPKFSSTIDTVNDMALKIKRGQGTMGRLFTDDALYSRVTQAANSLTSLTADIRTGEGALSNLIYSDELSVSAGETFAEVKKAATGLDGVVSENRDKIARFVYTLGSLSPKLEAAADNINNTMENFSQISEDINSGKGTLGQLVKDPSLFDDARSTVNQIRATFEESEEQSVIRTVLSVLIGPVM